MKNLIILIFYLALFSCKSDDNGPEIVDVTGSTVLILNEGNFNFGNASISLYNSEDKTVDNKVFQSNNNGRPIGDVVQSAVQFYDEVFLVVNNSSKVEILGSTTFKFSGSIQGFNSPRYIQLIHDSKAYVSDLYEDKIYIINPTAKKIVKTIETKGWIEEMVMVGSKIFACHVDSNQIWVFDSNTDQILAKIPTHNQPQYIEKDKNNSIWVSCTGGFSGDKSALYKINSTTLTTELVLEGDSLYKIGEIEMNSSKDELNYLGPDGLYVVSIKSTALPIIPKIQKNSRLFYSLSINPLNNDIYITDAIDYQQKGVVYRYDLNGSQLDAFKVGIIPGDILFLK